MSEGRGSGLAEGQEAVAGGPVELAPAEAQAPPVRAATEADDAAAANAARPNRGELDDRKLTLEISVVRIGAEGQKFSEIGWSEALLFHLLLCGVGAATTVETDEDGFCSTDTGAVDGVRQGERPVRSFDRCNPIASRGGRFFLAVVVRAGRF